MLLRGFLYLVGFIWLVTESGEYIGNKLELMDNPLFFPFWIIMCLLTVVTLGYVDERLGLNRRKQ